jgi:predicted acyltransferase
LTPRLISLDALRGFTMIFMASEILRIPQVLRRVSDGEAARAAAGLLDHRAWAGCSPWDLIQPAFMFLVGVALPYSIARRRADGQPFGRQFAHGVYRALILIALGIFLRSQARPQTYFTFEDVLTQIGLGYVFLFLLGWARPAVQWAAAAAILAGYWAAFALYPLPPAGFDTTLVGVPADWPHRLSGFAAHWDKNTNLAAAFDQWFLNLFPRERPFVFNSGGYLTLNFVPSLATMIFGLLAGGLLQSARTQAGKVRTLVLYGVAGIAAGAALHALGLVPIVKRIWTPSWTLYSTGWVLLILAAYYYAIDVGRDRPREGIRRDEVTRPRWTLPLVVVGMNSIAMYVLVHVADAYIARALRIHLGQGFVEMFGPAFAPVVLGASTLGILWLMLYWMYRRRIFLRI